MLAALLVVALAQVPQPQPGPWPEAGAVSPVVSLIAWDKGGSQDWGAGIPSPTIDCAAVGTSASASLQCSGATPTFAGPGQTAAGSPWWYRGDSGVRPSIVLNGSTDYWTLGDVGDTTSDVAACVEFKAASVAGVTFLWGKSDNATGPWHFYQTSGSLRFWVTRSSGYTDWGIGTITPGTWYLACAGYHYVADGSSTIRTTLNGIPGTPTDTAVGPLQDTTHNLAIGAITNGGYKWSGAIRRAAAWIGPSAPTSASQLAQLVATQNGLAHDKPAGAVASCSRSDSTLCGPFSDAEQFLLGPGFCCIHAPTYSGWASGGAVAGGIEIWGPGANALGYSETFANAAWVKSTGVTASDASASCPMSPLAGTRMSLVTTDSDADQIAQDAATTPGRSVWMARATGDSACGVTFADASGDGAQSLALTDGPVRYWSGGTGQTGLSVARPVGGCARWCMWMAQAQASIYPVPPRSTPGASPYSGAASTATTVTVPVAPSGVTDASGTVAVTFTSPAPVYPNAILGVGSDWLLIAAGSTSARVFDGTTEVPSITVPDMTLGTTLGVAWSGAVESLFTPTGGVLGSHAYDGAFVAGWTKFSVGARADGTYTNPGIYRRFAQCRKAGGCR